MCTLLAGEGVMEAPVREQCVRSAGHQALGALDVQNRIYQTELRKAGRHHQKDCPGFYLGFGNVSLVVDGAVFSGRSVA